jgi:hypothetical protein
VNLAYSKFRRVINKAARAGDVLFEKSKSYGQAAWLWPRRRCWAVSIVGANSGMVPCDAVRSVVVAWCALVADYAMKLCTDVWHMIFDDSNVKGDVLFHALEDRIGMFP